MFKTHLICLAFLMLQHFALVGCDSDKPNMNSNVTNTETVEKTAPEVIYPQFEVTTNQGRFVLELFPDKAPKTVDNFTAYVKAKAYDGSIFHRVISNFMIQGGGFNQQLELLPTTGYIINESNNGLSNTTGTIAMARKQHPDSANRQFFINVADNSQLDYPAHGGGYTVFGKVSQGMPTVIKLSTAPTESKPPFLNLPKNMIIIESIREI